MQTSENAALNFKSEAALEKFVWDNLWELLSLTPIARQYYIEGQLCDILATDLNKQLVVIELKNTEDRYIIQQLTRYYDSLQTHQPFAEQVDYEQPIRLLAIAPQFHKHSFVDRRHSLLNYQFASFRIIQTDEKLHFELVDSDTHQIWSLAIPPNFHPLVVSIFNDISEPVHEIPPPPKSLRKILEGTSSQTQVRILTIREQILNFNYSMREVGLTTRTQYGLAKGDKDVYQGKLCAKFLPSGFSKICMPRLLLKLPYPKKQLAGSGYGNTYKRERVKGMSWAEVASGEQWTNQEIYFYLGKSRNIYSFHCTLAVYTKLYNQLTGKAKRLDSLDRLIDAALEEWLEMI